MSDPAIKQVTGWLRERVDANPAGGFEFFQNAKGELAAVTHTFADRSPSIVSFLYSPRSHTATFWNLRPFGRTGAVFGQLQEGEMKKIFEAPVLNPYDIKFSSVGTDLNEDGIASWLVGMNPAGCFGVSLPWLFFESAFVAVGENGFTVSDMVDKKKQVVQKAGRPQDVFDQVSESSVEIVRGGLWKRISRNEFMGFISIASR